MSYQLEQSSLRVLGGEAGPTRRAIHTLCRLTCRGEVQRKPRTNHATSLTKVTDNGTDDGRHGAASVPYLRAHSLQLWCFVARLYL